ncbi:hypothetical protein L1987_54469 [Smallanthus sonchifolius]|uniref:Uncharacterized protein n=1 Tax=Smallanthus sonchifolius TaxID=185202 RepID=A0ACB9E7B0_9ASTR|nr:hypothetical protein L1987_54469 [Smallanthus sonchifolius]
MHLNPFDKDIDLDPNKADLGAVDDPDGDPGTSKDDNKVESDIICGEIPSSTIKAYEYALLSNGIEDGCVSILVEDCGFEDCSFTSFQKYPYS